MSDEWGPWIEHDGTAPPGIAEGSWVNIVGFNFDGTPHEAEGQYKAAYERLPQWMWALVNDPAIGRIIRYRIRKPRGLTILENLIADLPAPSLPDRATA
jgi:hypothetical protein